MGPQGPSGVVLTLEVVGNVAPTITGNRSEFVFVGPSGSVTITGERQRVTGTASAPLGLVSSAPGPQTAGLGLCYQRAGEVPGPLVNFFGAGFANHYFTTTRVTYSVSGTTVLSEGTWNVGMCVLNNGPSTIAGRHTTAGGSIVNGWFIVTRDD
jgi:hypothetical protein